MRHKYFNLIFILALGILSACTSQLLRLPSSIGFSYDPQHVRLLEEVAQQGILFQFDDDYLKDIPRAQVADTCTVTDETQWGEQYYDILRVFERNPLLYKKIHVVQLKKGDMPSVDISREYDGAIYLILTYQKTQRRENISEGWIKKCSGSGDVRDQIMVDHMDWPTPNKIVEFLQKQPDKAQVARFTFNNGFLLYLARHATVLRLTSSFAAEKSLQGEPVLPNMLGKLATQVAGGRFGEVDSWLQQIDRGSRLGHQIKYFQIVQDQKLARGIALDGSNATVLSRTGQQSASTYLYLSYSSHGGDYSFSSLGDLNECLRTMQPAGENWTNPERFLNPGKICEQE